MAILSDVDVDGQACRKVRHGHRHVARNIFSGYCLFMPPWTYCHSATAGKIAADYAGCLIELNSMNDCRIREVQTWQNLHTMSGNCGNLVATTQGDGGCRTCTCVENNCATVDIQRIGRV